MTALTLAHDVQATAARIFGLDRTPTRAKFMLSALLGIEGGALIVRTPHGQALRFGDDKGADVDLTIRDWRFVARVAGGGDIGFAESWIAGEWTSGNLAALLTLLSANAERFMAYFKGGWSGQLIARIGQARRANTYAGSRRNILAHYDLGNAFFAEWLDASMTYSSARFDLAEALDDAQGAKYEALAQMLRLKPGDRMLEIGCGWGGFAEHVARCHGARVLAITISDEQYSYATDRIARAGLAGQVEVRLQDYRDVEGQFDAVASIEMIEAVGEAYWLVYFDKIAALLKPGGRCGIQAITIRDDLFDGYRQRADFIQSHIFPGGMLPSLARLHAETAAAGLNWLECAAFGQSYARTLAAWTDRFEARWQTIRGLGFDERFHRLWLFYLAYCEAGFRSKRTDVVQVALEKPL